MSPRITHSKVSGKPNPTDASKVGGEDWDADHVIDGLTIGTDVQAHDTTLDALAAFDANGIIVQYGTDQFTARTLTGTANEITVANGAGASGNPTFSLPSALTFTGKTVTGGTYSGIASLSADVSNPTLIGPLSSFYAPSADSGNKGALSIQTTWDSGNGGLNGASIVANAVVETTAGAVGAPGAIIAGTLVKGDIVGLDPYGIVGIINNDTAVTSGVGVGIWAIPRGAKAGGVVDGIRSTSEVDAGQHPRAGLVVYNSDPLNAYKYGLWTASATDYGVVVGNPAGTSVNDVFPTYPFAVWGKNLGTTIHDGLLLYNATAAAAGAQQASPAIHWAGAGWKTNATAASRPLDWLAYLLPVQGAAAPTSQLIFAAQVNGWGFNSRVIFTDSNGIGINAAPSTSANPGDVTLAGSSSGSTRLTATAAASGVLTLPAATDTLVGKATTDILTGKSMDGGSNTFTNIPASAVVSAALTRTNDTNVTLTLGGSPTTALLNAASITVGWSGTLAPSRGGTGISSLGTGVATALGVNVGSAGAFVTFNGALGTPSSGTLSNCTGLPVSTGISGLGTDVAAFLATPSSANLAAAVTDETGSGALVFGTSPTFTTQITSPKVVGGTSAGSVLTLQTTTGTGSGDRVDIVGGTNGATTFASFKSADSTIANALISTGSAAGFATSDRSVPGQTYLYRNAGLFALYNYGGTGGVTGDMVTFDQTTWAAAFKSTTASTSTTSGGATFAGGIGCAGDINVAGYVATVGNVSANGQATSLTGTGYRAGAGGTVTQSTSKATGVTLNKACGQITTPNDLLAASTTTSFTFTNSTIGSTDLLALDHVSGGTIGGYDLFAVCGSGSATVYIRNRTAGALSEAIVIRFALIKAATS